MIIRMFIAFISAFLISASFGKWLVPWLQDRGAEQPLKKEVSKIYEENDKNQ